MSKNNAYRIVTAEQLYAEAKKLMKSGKKDDYDDAVLTLRAIKGYEDSAALIKQCRASLEALRQKREKKTAVILGLLAALIGAALFVVFWVVPTVAYNDAVDLLEAGKYSAAKDAFDELDGFGKSEEKIAMIELLPLLDEGELTQAVSEILHAGEGIEIRYDINEGNSISADSESYSPGAAFYEFLTPERDKYKFEKWELLSYRYADDRLEINLSAVWTGDYTITYDLDGGKTEDKYPTSYSLHGNSIKLANPTKDSCVFLGWTGTDLTEPTRDLVIPAGSYGDREYFANWEKLSKISYILTGGGSNNPKTYSSITETFTLSHPVKYGFVFVGWTGTDLTEPTMEVTIPKGSSGDRTYTAKWEPVENKIYLDATGGTAPEYITVAYNRAYTLPTPQREGYTFLGWYQGSANWAQSSSAWKYLKDVYLTAKWSLASYTIKYKLPSDATNNPDNPTNYTVYDSITDVKAPTRKGARFLGWYTDVYYTKKFTGIPKGSTGDITLYAKWELTTYTITYKTNGGTISGTPKTTFTVEDLPLTLPIPGKPGEDFACWNEGSLAGKGLLQITEPKNTTLVAVYVGSNLKLKQSFNGQSYSVTDYNGKDTELVIPAYYQGKPVTEIDDYAFGYYYSGYANKTLVTVYIPSTVKTFGSNVFGYCSALKNVYIAEGVTEIGNGMFESCDALVDVVLPNTLITIGAEAFYDCDGLVSITIPDSVTTIGGDAFNGCGRLTTVTLPASLETIGSYAFRNCSALTSITIPGSVTSIGSSAFSGCTKLTKAVLLQGVKTVGYNMFDGCTALTEVTLPQGLTKIDSYAFDGCTSLKKIIIPKSVEYIDSSAFYGCSAVTFYCRASQWPNGTGWEIGWNNNRPITWGYTGN